MQTDSGPRTDHSAVEMRNRTGSVRGCCAGELGSIPELEMLGSGPTNPCLAIPRYKIGASSCVGSGLRWECSSKLDL